MPCNERPNLARINRFGQAASRVPPFQAGPCAVPGDHAGAGGSSVRASGKLAKVWKRLSTPVTARMRTTEGALITRRSSPPLAWARFIARTSTLSPLESQNSVLLKSTTIVGCPVAADSSAVRSSPALLISISAGPVTIGMPPANLTSNGAGSGMAPTTLSEPARTDTGYRWPTAIIAGVRRRNRARDKAIPNRCQDAAARPVGRRGTPQPAALRDYPPPGLIQALKIQDYRRSESGCSGRDRRTNLRPLIVHVRLQPVQPSKGPNFSESRPDGPNTPPQAHWSPAVTARGRRAILRPETSEGRGTSRDS